MSYNGPERRHESLQDRERLIRMDANLSNLIEIHKEHLEKFTSHIAEDNRQFSILNKFMWVIIGGSFLMTYIIKFSK